MADVDEDRIPTATHNNNSSDDESDDGAAVDYRLLGKHKPGQQLPSRGEKDFEPNPTLRQANVLKASRDAMYEVLSVERIHTASNSMVGVYLPNKEDWDAVSWDGGRRSGSLKPGEGRCVVVERFISTFGKSIGAGDRRNWTWLLPEEALFLLDRGTLDIRWPELDDEEATATTDQALGESNDDVEDESASQTVKQTGTAIGNPQVVNTTALDAAKPEQRQLKVGKLPMSLQGAYATLIGKSELTLERYIVYTNLRRIGYIAQRAPTWSALPSQSQSQQSTTSTPDETISTGTTASTALTTTTQRTPAIAFIYSILQWLFPPPRHSNTPAQNRATGPLISPTLYRRFGDLFRDLALITTHRRELQAPPTKTSSSQHPDPYRPAWIIYKPSTPYRKTAPPPPDFHVAVVSARAHPSIPNSKQIASLLSYIPDHEPLANAERKRLETKIKHGRRSGVVAVVDCGVVSYLRFGVGGFEGEALFEENERKGQARGTKGGGGRGRGRGQRRGRGGARGRSGRGG